MTQANSAHAPAMAAIVPGRDCGACSMCCKLTHVASLAKPAGQWCAHVDHGHGCAIYADRPGECRAFVCDWLINPKLTPEWKPDASKLMVFMTSEGNCSVIVDAAHPDAWRDPRFYPVLKRYAASLVDQGRLMTVAIGEKMTAVLPNKDIELGRIPPGHRIVVGVQRVHGLPEYTAMVAPAKSPAA